LLDLKNFIGNNNTIANWFENKEKTLDSFINELDKYLQKNGDITVFIKPLLELAETLSFPENSTGLPDYRESYPIEIFLMRYYSRDLDAKPDFIDLISVSSQTVLASFLARYKQKYTNDQTTNMYRLSDEAWLELGNKIHEKFINEWNKIIELNNFDFVGVLECWKFLITETQFVKLQKLVEDEFKILNLKDSNYFKKDMFVKTLQKFAYKGFIYNIENGDKKRISDFSYTAYQRLNKFVSWDKIKEIIEKHKLYSEYQICKDFIEGFDNKDIDVFKLGWGK
jgi:hypothetical protein